MYVCKNCGNKRDFIEHVCVTRRVTFRGYCNSTTSRYDEDEDCVEVVCGVCNATTEDGNILDGRTKEKIILDV